MAEGIIMKALSGFYYVDDGIQLTACRGRGRLRQQGVVPLVGDHVRFTSFAGGGGALEDILPRRNQFSRPAVANIDQLVLLASQAIPVTDPFLIDRMAVLAAYKGCAVVICINKCDLESGEELARIYRAAGFPTVRLSARTGEGLEELKEAIAQVLRAGKVYLEKLFPYDQAGKLQTIRKSGTLLSEEYTEDGIAVEAYVPAEVYGGLL